MTSTRPIFLFVGLAALSLAAIAGALLSGSADLSPQQTWQAVTGDAPENIRVLVMDLRLPRALTAFAVGGLLAVAGVLMQVLLRNPLAEPYILGSSGGASVAALLGMMLGGAGLKVVDAGTDVSPDKFVEICQAEGAAVCAMSALLTTTMPQMTEVVKAIKDAGIGVKTMIGGAPVTQNFADEIGADGYAPDAASAVDVAKQLIGV